MGEGIGETVESKMLIIGRTGTYLIPAAQLCDVATVFITNQFKL